MIIIIALHCDAGSGARCIIAPTTVRASLQRRPVSLVPAAIAWFGSVLILAGQQFEAVISK